MFKRTMHTFHFILLAYVLTALPVCGAERRGQVRWVADGDTIVLKDGERVRYADINTPEVAHDGEPGEPYGY